MIAISGHSASSRAASRKQSSGGDHRVRVDDEDDLAHAQRPRVRCPGFVSVPRLGVRLLDRHLEGFFFEALFVFEVVRVVAFIVVFLGSVALEGGAARLARRARLCPLGAPGLELVLELLDAFLHLEGQRQTVVHVARFLESSSTFEAVGVASVVCRPRYEADTMIRIELAWFRNVKNDERVSQTSSEAASACSRSQFGSIQKRNPNLSQAGG